MKNLFAALALVLGASSVFGGEKAQAPVTTAAKPVKAEAKSCETCQVVEVARRPLFGGRRCATETVMVESSKKVTVLEPKKVLVEKTVMVPTTKEVKTVTPVKVAKAASCDCCEGTCTTVVGRRGLLRR